jgi:hypothetical protein
VPNPQKVVPALSIVLFCFVPKMNQQALTFLSRTFQDGKLEFPAGDLAETVMGLKKSVSVGVNHVMERIQIMATAEKERVAYKIQFVVTVLPMDGQYVEIPLLGTELTIADVDTEGSCHFGFSQGQQTLFCFKEETVNVELTAFGPYSSDKKTGVNFCIPKCSQTSLKFTVPYPDLDIVVRNSVNAVTSKEEESSTCVTCNLSPTDTVNVQWTAQVGSSVLVFHVVF